MMNQGMKNVQIPLEIHNVIKKIVNNRKIKLEQNYPTIQQYVTLAIKNQLEKDLQQIKEYKGEYEFPLERILIKKETETTETETEEKNNEML